jgi:hypothetical protein
MSANEIQDFAEVMADWAGDDSAPGNLTHAEWETFASVGDFDSLRTSCRIGEEEVRNAMATEGARLDALAAMTEGREPTADEIDEAQGLTEAIWKMASDLWAEQIERDTEARGGDK